MGIVQEMHERIERAGQAVSEHASDLAGAPLELLIELDSACQALDEYCDDNLDYQPMPILERYMLFVMQTVKDGPWVPVAAWDRDWHVDRYKHWLPRHDFIRDTAFVGEELFTQTQRSDITGYYSFARAWWQDLPAAMSAPTPDERWDALKAPIILDGVTYEHGSQPLIYCGHANEAANTLLAHQELLALA